MLWAGIFLWRDKRSWKPCVCNYAVQSKKTSRGANTPERDCTSDRVDSLGQGDQAGNTCDDDRDHANGHQHSDDDNQFPRARILGCDNRFHGRGNYCAPTPVAFNRNVRARSRQVDVRCTRLKFAGNEKCLPRNFLGRAKP